MAYRIFLLSSVAQVRMARSCLCWSLRLSEWRGHLVVRTSSRVRTPRLGQNFTGVWLVLGLRLLACLWPMLPCMRAAVAAVAAAAYSAFNFKSLAFL